MVALSATAAFSQVVTARMDGTVTDSGGATVPAAQVDVLNVNQQQSYKVTSDEKGYWAIPSLPSGTYKVTLAHQGFKTQVVDNVKMDAGVPATVNVTLQVGALTETIEVTSGAEVLQTDSATIASTLQGTQIHDLPFTSHNATDLIATQPGTQTAQGPRYSVINGLPQSTINITLDGVNIQDNTNKSTDGVFNNVQARTEAIEEMTLSTAAAGADSTGEGSAQVKFVTRSGSNQWHGGVFETNRNTFFEANYYFNSVNQLKRDYLNLNEWGYRLGGPAIKNKLFFFTTFEFFFLPQSFLTQNELWLNQSATNGIFTYKDGSGTVRTVNLYSLAAAAGFPSTPNATMGKALSLIQQLTSQGGTLASRIGTNNDYNRNNFAFPNKATNNRKFETTRIDYNLTDKHHLSGVWNYQVNSRNPDGLNGTLAVLPGTGSVLGTPSLQGQYGLNWTGSVSIRSSLTAAITNEATLGVQAGTNILGSGTTAADYALFNNVQPNNFGSYMSVPYLGGYLSFAPRNAPVWQFNDNVSWLKGNHLLSFGGGFTQVNYWQAAANNSLIPQVSLATVAGDPVSTGSTSLFTTGNFPGASSAQLSDATNLYDILTGRVASVTTSQVLNEQTHTYGPNYTVDRDRLREFSLYAQDSWRVNSSLTLSLGLRWDKQNPFENQDGLYTSVGLAGLYGVSGIGNLFKPGTLAGSAPVFTPVSPGGDSYQSRFGNFNPNVGFAYKVPKQSGPLSWLTGKGDAVIRGGFSIATIREGMGFLAGVLNGNQGRSLSTSVDPLNFPANFGPIGSVAFGGAYPTRAPTSIDPNFPNPSFPLAAQSGQTVSDYNPNIKPEYVESWSIGFQRELDRDTVIEARYVGTHGVGLWRSVNLNEVNVVESGFAQQFAVAQQNLAIANGFTSIGALQNTVFTNPAFKLVTNYGNTGLAGQAAIPIIQTAIGSTTDTTTANQLLQGQTGATANAIATNATRMSALTKAGYPVNLFQVNPLNGGNANMMTNGNMSTYNALQIEVRRRLSHGLQVQGSYAFAKSLTNDTNFTLRNIGGEKGPSPFDFRNGFKFTWIYQLPFGQGRPFLSSAHGVLGKAVEGWQISGVGRLQSGSAVQLNSGRLTFNQNDSGVVLHNLTASQLQGMMSIYKTSQVNPNGSVTGTVWYLPQSLVQNTLSAFQLVSTPLDPNAPYIGPCISGGQECNRAFLYGPWLSKWDVSLVKVTRIHERFTAEIRCQALNVFNFANFELTSATSGGGGLTIGSNFGQTTSAFRDLNNTNDPGSRTLEFVFRLNF
jgi:hypothetical protein